MIRYFYKSVRSTAVELLDTYKPGSWVYVEDPSEEEIKDLCEKFGLEEGMITDALDEDEVPRLEKDDGTIYLFTRFAYTSDDLQITTSPLLIVLADKLMVTVAPKPLPRLHRLIEGKVDITTTQQTKLLLQLLELVVDQYDGFLGNISRQIKSIRSRLRVEEIRNQDFISFVQIEDELNEFLSALIPTNAILRRLLHGKHLKLHEEDEDLVEDLLLNNDQSIEACRSSLKSIVNIREAYSTIMSNNLNRVIRILTVVTVVLAIPTMISGVYGMNIRLPLMEYAHAFTIIISISVLTSLITLWVFRRQKWL